MKRTIIALTVMTSFAAVAAPNPSPSAYDRIQDGRILSVETDLNSAKLGVLVVDQKADAALSQSSAALNLAGEAKTDAQQAQQKHAEDGFNLQRVPSIELNCTGLGSVVFWTTGELEGDNVQADYVDRVNNAIYFTNGVKLSGAITGDMLLFDNATLRIHDKDYSCSGE